MDNSQLQDISSNHSLDRFLGYSNSLFYIELRDYFRTGKRKGFIEPLAFLNLFDKQSDFIEECMKEEPAKPFTAVNHLMELPINDELRHILLGALLKSYNGGYPVYKGEGRTENKFYGLKILLEEEFLGYKGDTPEKEYFKMDWRSLDIKSRIVQEAIKIVSGVFFNNKDFIHIDMSEMRVNTYEMLAKFSKNDKLDIVEKFLNEQQHKTLKIYENLFEETNKNTFYETIKHEIETEPDTEIATPPPAKGFNLGYSVEQLTSLHKALIHENYLTGTVTDFINAFTGNPIKDKLEWIDKAQRVKSVNSHTLLQLLFSLNISLQDDRKVINQNVKDSINYVFSNNFGNINSKYNGFIESYTERQKHISTIVQKALNLN